MTKSVWEGIAAAGEVMALQHQVTARRQHLENRRDSMDAPSTDFLPVLIVDHRAPYHGMDWGFNLDRLFAPKIDVRTFSSEDSIGRFLARHCQKVENGLIIMLDDCENGIDGVGALAKLGALRPKYLSLRTVQPYTEETRLKARDHFHGQISLSPDAMVDGIDYEFMLKSLWKKKLAFDTSDFQGISAHVQAVLNDSPQPALDRDKNRVVRLASRHDRTNSKA